MEAPSQALEDDPSIQSVTALSYSQIEDAGAPYWPAKGSDSATPSNTDQDPYIRDAIPKVTPASEAIQVMRLEAMPELDAKGRPPLVLGGSQEAWALAALFTCLCMFNNPQ